MKARCQGPQLLNKVSTERLYVNDFMPGADAVVGKSLRIERAFNQFVCDLKACGDSSQTIAHTLPIRVKALAARQTLREHRPVGGNGL